MKRVFGAGVLALILFALCLQGARWQFDRHEVRHSKNELIRENTQRPAITENQLANLENVAWRTINIAGRFIPDKEILVRNRYHEGQYGFGVITLFQSSSGKRYWVDRGWVIAGPDAQTPPKTKPIDGSEVEITGRVRVANIEAQVSGTVFAVPGEGGKRRLTKWDQESSLTTEPVYFDLLDSSRADFVPDVPTVLPELSDGPHLAYSVQWVLFAGMVLFGLYLVIREERKAQEEKV